MEKPHKHHSEMTLEESAAFLEEEKRKFFREGLRGGVLVPVDSIPHFKASREREAKKAEKNS